MVFSYEVAELRQAELIRISALATSSGLRLWRSMSFTDLDASWARIEAAMVARIEAAQLQAARSADAYVSRVARADKFKTDAARIAPESFVGVDGSGRPVGSLLHGAVTTTKRSIGAGLGRDLAFQAGAAYLAAMIKTALADSSRSADMVSSAGKGYTLYARVVEGGACNRCVVLAGATQFRAFKRHPACKCSVQPIVRDDHGDYSPEAVFGRMSRHEQDKAFGKAGAEAIREGADISSIVSARRGASGIGYGARGPTSEGWRRMQKTTIGVRPNGSLIQVYETVEGTTVRGSFGRAQAGIAEARRLAGARYSSTSRIRLMPETIFEIAGNDKALRQAFLRDAGYLQYHPKNGYDSGNKWIAEMAEQRRQDRILVNRATLRYGNFTLG